MDKIKDPMEDIIKEDLLLEAECLKKELEESDVEGMSTELKDKIRGKLHEQIAEYERNRVYENMSEEDRKALELGRQMLKEQEDAKGKTVVYRKKRPKLWIALAAVLVLVMAMGVTGIGGPERIMEIIGINVGEREVVQVNSEDNYVITNEKEEKAYQELKDVFGVEAVKIFHRPEELKFVFAEIDNELQLATFIYDYNGNHIYYYISANYKKGSWGIDVEDIITEQYYIDHEKKGKIEITEYETIEQKTKNYSTHFSHNGLEYFITGVIEKENFEFLLKNLQFF